AAGRQKNLRRGRMRILLEEVMLDFPHMVDAELVGELDLIEGVLEKLELGAGRPRAGELMFIEGAEFHGAIVFSLGDQDSRPGPPINSVRSTISITSRLRCSIDLGSNMLTFHS